MKKTTIGIVLILAMSNSHAGFKGLTHHSRANCAGFNETVTWWAGHSFLGRVESLHYDYGLSHPDNTTHHTLKTGKANTWRHAAYHGTESWFGDFYVQGFHYMYVNGREVCALISSSTDCSQYDGWWD